MNVMIVVLNCQKCYLGSQISRITVAGCSLSVIVVTVLIVIIVPTLATNSVNKVCNFLILSSFPLFLYISSSPDRHMLCQPVIIIVLVFVFLLVMSRLLSKCHCHCHCLCIFVGQVLSQHHSDQKSQSLKVSRVAL